jgi:ABC-type uncharacterized transport system YnjBCD ATPase subunit
MNIITFRDVTLTLSGRTILAGVSLAIAPGEFVGMPGPGIDRIARGCSCHRASLRRDLE